MCKICNNLKNVPAKQHVQEKYTVFLNETTIRADISIAIIAAGLRGPFLALTPSFSTAEPEFRTRRLSGEAQNCSRHFTREWQGQTVGPALTPDFHGRE